MRRQKKGYLYLNNFWPHSIELGVAPAFTVFIWMFPINLLMLMRAKNAAKQPEL